VRVPVLPVSCLTRAVDEGAGRKNCSAGSSSANTVARLACESIFTTPESGREICHPNYSVVFQGVLGQFQGILGVIFVGNGCSINLNPVILILSGALSEDASVNQIRFSPGFEIVQLLLPVLRDALWIAPGFQGFEHAPVGEQGFDFVHLKLFSGEFTNGGRDFQA
jgi:hypothetical protein